MWAWAHHIYKSAIDAALPLGRMDDAMQLAARVRESVAELSPHHRLHGVAFQVMTLECAGRWNAIRDMTVEIESAVEANESTPCLLNERTLLVVALASRVLGDVDEAARLERRADDIGMQGYEMWFAPVRVALAAERGDIARVKQMLAACPRELYGFGDAIQLSWRLVGLAALGDRELVESEAPPLVIPGTYLEPFALAALGSVRGDTEVLTRAVDRFREMGLEWHAARTQSLMP